ncbi:DUF1456 family protein [Flavobacterium sp. GT3R68]|uniref:DUF1456 family protein n=1 Tax=Flavobacterium sp. GT3R68 TaxID=2594437 RepID=UPI000F89BFDC|nr:DUF1456 family protein [Flavobacterium sp. GT3R68]RTY95317.1 DUF1456 family protein [Flavobacterium sp. GSN2]TRW90943.1 DUF1456 family protein [Flavobacterium sp. GT3R68]
MTNNDILKKLRVALMLRDDQIVEILELVDFRISKSELGAFFRAEDHENYVECGDQVLRNFLNALVIHLRGTKENPKNPADVLNKNKTAIKSASQDPEKARGDKEPAKKPYKKQAPNKATPKIQVVEKVRYNNGKNKKS